jgi:hypothetical protein
MTETQRPQWLLNAVTLAICLAWLVTFIVRQFTEISGAPVIDNLVLLVITFWFGRTAMDKTKQGAMSDV